jgi:hypothetical protein
MKPYASAGKRLGSKVMGQSLETFILLIGEARPFRGKSNPEAKAPSEHLGLSLDQALQ